jgi:hypothetical protein
VVVEKEGSKIGVLDSFAFELKNFGFPKGGRNPHGNFDFAFAKKNCVSEKMDFTGSNTNLIFKDFELSTDKEALSEEELLLLLADRMEYLIENRIEYLFSLMYRLDIPEGKVRFALSPLAPEPPHIGLARLVIERQKQRLFTKQFYKSKPSAPEDEESDW